MSQNFGYIKAEGRHVSEIEESRIKASDTGRRYIKSLSKIGVEKANYAIKGEFSDRPF